MEDKPKILTVQGGGSSIPSLFMLINKYKYTPLLCDFVFLTLQFSREAETIGDL